MSLSVSQIWIMLHFQQRLRAGSIRLVHPDQFRSFRKYTRAGFKICTLGSGDKLNAASFENVHQRSIVRRFNQKTKKLAWPARPHCFLTDRVEPSQPLLAICRGVVQQKKSRGGHVLRDVTQVPLTTTPEWPKFRRLLLRIVTLSRAQFFKLQCDRRGDPRRRSFRKNAHTAVIV